MLLGFVSIPLVQLGLLGAGLIGCLVFCLYNTLRARADKRRFSKSHQSFLDSLAAISAAMERKNEQEPAPEAVQAAPISGLNLTRRTQVLRMHRRGESLATIAAALQSPRNEIELLLKVHGYLNS